MNSSFAVDWQSDLSGMSSSEAYYREQYAEAHKLWLEQLHEAENVAGLLDFCAAAHVNADIGSQQSTRLLTFILELTPERLDKIQAMLRDMVANVSEESE